MGVPKRRTSKMKVRSRRAAARPDAPLVSACPDCGEPKLPHRICLKCGTYRGRQVLTIKAEGD